MHKKERLIVTAAVLTAMAVSGGAIGVRTEKISVQAAAKAANRSTVIEETIIEARIEMLDMDTKKQEFDKRAEVAIAALPTPTPTPVPTPKQVASNGKAKSSRGTSTASSTKAATTSSYAKGSGSYLGSGGAGSVVELALQYKGSAYVWGGEAPSGFDCSGFVKYIYANAVGISLPHSAKAQAKYGVAVSKSEVQLGDLVFFETYTAGISHVGIYIGNDQFIHASNAKYGVRISGFSGYKNFRGAVRLLQ